MTIAHFLSQDSNDQVALSVAPGSPDVLSLQTTNIPQVHARLVELRQRNDHPQGRPRAIWIDLTDCRNFSEVRGEVLVRALRLTQFLPCGFIGQQQQVVDMARATHLPRVDERSLLPRLASSASPSFSVEIEQRDDIMADMTRRLTALQQENAAQTQRANILSQALSTVRGKRDHLEVEVGELQGRLTRITGELEWAQVQRGSAEQEISNLMARIAEASAQREEASARADALEGGMQLVEQALVESRKEAYGLLLRVQDLEENSASKQEISALSEALDEARRQADNLADQITAREEDFASQRAEFMAANGTLRSHVGQLTASLRASQEALAQQQESMAVLVASRDAVEQQSALTSQMLEDALAKLEELTNQAGALDAQVREYQSQWSSLNEDYHRTREQLLAAQNEANQANQDLVVASEVAAARAQRIEELVNEGRATTKALEDAHLESTSLREALDLARRRTDEAEQALDVAREECVSSEQSIQQFRVNMQEKERLLSEISIAREQAITQCAALEATLSEQSQEVERLSAELAGTRQELSDAQSALLDASAEVAQVQASLDETNRTNAVLNQLLARNGSELAAAREEVDSLTHRLGSANEDLAQARAVIKEATAREAAAAEEASRRLAVAKAESESLSRRFLAAQEEAVSSAEQMNSVIEDLRASLSRQEAVNEEINEALRASRAELVESQEKVQGLSASMVRMQGQVQVLNAELDAAREAVRGCETTIVEQEGQIQRLATEVEEKRSETVALRDQVVVSDATVRRQQDQIESGRQTIAHVSQSLQKEQEAHSATRRECELATAEVSRLTVVVDEQADQINAISVELSQVRGVCEEQVQQLASVDGHVAEVERSARNDRRLRAQLETELVDAQDQLADLRQARMEVAQAPAPVIVEVPVAAPHAATVNHRDRVRSGQMVTSLGDLVVMKSVSSTAELRAVGSVHIYGVMGGRVHAGCQGDRSARVYCSHFAAEQVSIAGKTVNFETIPDTLRGHSVEIWLDSNNVMQVRATDME